MIDAWFSTDPAEGAFIAERLGTAVICSDCKTTLDKYRSGCTATPGVRCPGFIAIEAAKVAFADRSFANRNTKRFNDHLDECRQCREHPFGLCKRGADILTETPVGFPLLTFLDEYTPPAGEETPVGMIERAWLRYEIESPGSGPAIGKRAYYAGWRGMMSHLKTFCSNDVEDQRAFAARLQLMLEAMMRELEEFKAEVAAGRA